MQSKILKGGTAIAGYLDIGIATLYRHAHELPIQRIGRRLIADSRALDEWLQGKYVPTASMNDHSPADAASTKQGPGRPKKIRSRKGGAA